MMHKEKILRRVLPLALALALLLPMAPGGTIDAAASNQAAIDRLKQESASLAQQRAEVQAKLVTVRAEKNKLEEQKNLLEQDIALIQKEIDNIQGQIDAIESKIGSIQDQIDTIQNQIDQLTQAIEACAQRIQDKQAELEQTQAEEEVLYGQFCQRVRLMEESGEATYWTILFSSADFSDLLDNFMMVEEFIKYDNNMMDELLKLQAQVEAEKAELEEIKAEQESTRTEQQAAKVQQEQAKAEQQAAKTELEGAKAKQLASQQELRDRQAELQPLINQLGATEAQLSAQEAALRQAANAADAEIRRLEQQMAPQISSVQSEGSFAWPLPGYTNLSSLFGGRIHPITGRPNNHTGIDIPAPGGTSIKCAKSGVVTVSTYNGSYGNYVVVSHSDGTSTLYAHMSRRSVSVGQTVAQGAELGKVGTTGSSTGNHLHFEIRINGVRTDPVNYFSGLRVSGVPIS